MMPAGD